MTCVNHQRWRWLRRWLLRVITWSVRAKSLLHDDFALLDVERAINECDVIAVLVKHREFLCADVRETTGAGWRLDFVERWHSKT